MAQANGIPVEPVLDEAAKACDAVSISSYSPTCLLSAARLQHSLILSAIRSLTRSSARGYSVLLSTLILAVLFRTELYLICFR